MAPARRAVAPTLSAPHGGRVWAGTMPRVRYSASDPLSPDSAWRSSLFSSATTSSPTRPTCW